MKTHKNLRITTGISILMLLLIGIGTCSADMLAEAGGPYTVYEGVPVTINASGSYDSSGSILTYAWDFNNDGIYETPGFEITRTPIDGPRTRIIGLRVTNETGGFATNTTTWTVNNVNPVVHVGPNQTIDEGDIAYFYTNFSDVQPDMNASTAQIDYGDGNTQNIVANPSGTILSGHTYINDGTYTAAVTITDKDGGIGSDTLTITVNHVNPVVDHVPPPVNQHMGQYDTDIVNFKKSYLCRDCHVSWNMAHHLLTGYICNDCHPNGYSAKDIDVNCLNCHNGSAYYANPDLILQKPHHNTTKNSISPTFQVAYWAIDRKCNLCHGNSNIDNYNDGHYISTTTTSMTSSVCNNCHDQNLSLNRPILTNRNTHHNATDTTQGFQCTYCHADSGNNFPIKECEQCHGELSLHNIESSSPGLNIAETLLANIPGYGHIGNNSDCKGCHVDTDHGDDCKWCHITTESWPKTMVPAKYFTGSISGTKFNDSNGNGSRDADESGVSGVNITIYRINITSGLKTFVNRTTTDNNGNYTFINLSEDFYGIREKTPLGSSQTFPAAGADYYINMDKHEKKTGVDFGNQKVPPGGISGNVFNDTNGNGVKDDGENGISGIKITLASTGKITSTDSNGNYTFDNVPVGMQLVYEELMIEYVATTQRMDHIRVNSSETSFLNFGNRKPVPPQLDVSIMQQYDNHNGVPMVYSHLDKFTIQKNLADVSNILGVNVTLKWISSQTIKTAEMVQIGTTGVWEVDFSPPFPAGTVQMTFNEDVTPVGLDNDIVQIGDIVFVDPSGQIRSTCNNKPIDNATVTLYVEFPPTTGNFIVSPPEYQLEPNPQTTSLDGLYGWMTIPGTYKVNVTRTGYNSNESESVIVPPPKTGLDILLTPTDGCSYDFTGFFQPVENPPVLNKAKAGSAIPLKFSLNGNQGLDIFETGYPKSSVIACEGPNNTIGDNETMTAGNSGLSYNQTTDQYNYVWKTDKTWTYCRQLVIKLKDGTYHRANFGFSK